ncbi:MAG: hypothetical protein ACYC9Y_01015 [Candidatus Methylomirabilia bacterium]
MAYDRRQRPKFDEASTGRGQVQGTGGAGTMSGQILIVRVEVFSDYT